MRPDIPRYQLLDIYWAAVGGWILHRCYADGSRWGMFWALFTIGVAAIPRTWFYAAIEWWYARKAQRRRAAQSAVPAYDEYDQRGWDTRNADIHTWPALQAELDRRFDSAVNKRLLREGRDLAGHTETPDSGEGN